jgi:pimeloyl-ACP methyl ester carboxylesterase
VHLTVHTTGSGPRQAALLHGVSGDADIFADLVDVLTSRFRFTVHAVDLRGHGHSPRAASYSLPEFADDVVETLPHGLDVVIGHSLGGRVLLDAVDRLRPARAVYLDPAFRAPAATAEVAGRANVSEHEDGTAFDESELAALNPLWGADNVRRALTAHSRWDPVMFEQVMAEVATVDAPDGPPVVPSLVVLAEESQLVDEELAARLASWGWQVRVQAGAGHNLHLDDVEATVRALHDWI